MKKRQASDDGDKERPHKTTKSTEDSDDSNDSNAPEPQKRTAAKRASTDEMNISIENWLKKKYADDKLVTTIQQAKVKQPVPIYILCKWIAKAADLVATEKHTDSSADLTVKARYHKISNQNIANLLGWKGDWLSQCVLVQDLILKKGGINDQVKRYLDPASKDDSLFGAKSFLDYLKTL